MAELRLVYVMDRGPELTKPVYKYCSIHAN
jgi:hypothetical protein